MKMMDPTTTVNKILRLLRFRKHLKELTSTCKRINQETCYETGTHRHLNSSKKSTRIQRLRKKISNEKQSKYSSLSPSSVLARATPSDPANLTMIVKQSYKPLHNKSSQLNQNTIAVSKDTLVKCLYSISNWVFVEIQSTGQTGLVPSYCFDLNRISNEFFTNNNNGNNNNLSLLNVSINEKSMMQNMVTTPDTLSAGRFISSIGPCQNHLETFVLKTNPVNNRNNVQHRRLKDQSNLSRQISNVSLHAYDFDAYETLNLTPCRSLSLSILDQETNETEKTIRQRLRVMENYEKRFVGDVSVLESEVVTRLDQTISSESHWRLVRRGDGRQGFVPKNILINDQHLSK